MYEVFAKSRTPPPYFPYLFIASWRSGNSFCESRAEATKDYGWGGKTQRQPVKSPRNAAKTTVPHFKKFY